MKNKKEFIHYIFGGILTTILHIVLFWILKLVLKYNIANIITLVIVKLTAYLVNKKYVFKSNCNTKKELVKEIIKYILSRTFTGILDYIGLIILVEICMIDPMISKIIILATITIINYLLSKYYIYKKS